MMIKMKKMKFWHAFAIIALMVGFSASCTKDEGIVLDFTITVPENWIYFALANQGLVYTGQRGQINEQDTLREYVLIYKEPLTGYTLDMYYNAIKGQLLATEEYVSTIEEKDTIINGADSKRIIFNDVGYYIIGRDSIDLNQITTMYFFYENSAGFNVSFVSIDTLYDEIKPVFDDIISTFTFKN
jgi:hypothetical protein